MSDELFVFDDDYISKEGLKVRSDELEEALSKQEEELMEKFNELETTNIIPRPRLNLTPPENFSLVCGQIYRSAFPKEENLEFLSRLKLKSIICLISDDYPDENMNFIKSQGLNFYQVGLSGNKEPFVKIKANLIEDALKIVLNPANHPILIHCNRGKHRTGCLVGCIRKLQKWSLSMIFDEYRKFSYPKQRPLDQQFIEMFDDDEINEYLTSRNWLPIKV